MTDLYFLLSNTLTAVNSLAYPHCNCALKGQQNNALQNLLRKSPRQRLILQTTLTPIWSMIRNKHNSTDVLLYVPQVWNK